MYGCENEIGSVLNLSENENVLSQSGCETENAHLLVERGVHYAHRVEPYGARYVNGNENVWRYDESYDEHYGELHDVGFGIGNGEPLLYILSTQ